MNHKPWVIFFLSLAAFALGCNKEQTSSEQRSVKGTSQKAFDSLNDGFQQSRQWLSDKIAP